jgi:RNA polymerase sigma factor (TIGR02999 family)
MTNDRDQWTRLLQHAGDDPAAARTVFPRVYDELRRIAAACMRRERPGSTLQATALVHEAWVGLLGPEGEELDWNSRAHFFGAAAQAMRRILIDRARAARRLKRGGDLEREPLELAEQQVAALDDQGLDYLALDEALDRLAAQDERMAKIVELRFFAGLSVDDTAHALSVSPRTVKREWAVAKAWLQREIGRA